MKKIMLFILINCLMVYGIIPMNVGNKWWYQYQRNSESHSYFTPSESITSCSKEKWVFTADKDTIVSGKKHKKIIYRKHSLDGIDSGSELWFDNDSVAYKSFRLLFIKNQADTIWSNYTDHYQLSNFQSIYLGSHYSIQKIQLHNYESGPGFVNSNNNSSITADGLGLVEISDLNQWAGNYYQGQDIEVLKLMAGQINGVFTGDTTNIDINYTDILNDSQKNLFLLQNYPNPFNPSTMIQFSLAKPAMTELKVYNSRGEVVKTLIKGLCNAGNQQVQFDGNSLASGVYYYQLTTQEQSLSGKMMLIK